MSKKRWKLSSNTSHTLLCSGFRPTGSTAYSLAAGGALLHPLVNALELVPIAPHSMSSCRPIVVGDDSVVRVSLAATCRLSFAAVHLDGQRNLSMEPGDELKVTRSPFPLRTIYTDDSAEYTGRWAASFNWCPKVEPRRQNPPDEDKEKAR